MAKSSNKPKPVFELKHRLVGAAILIFGAVLFIPMLLEEPKLQASISSQTDSDSTNEEKTFKSKIEPINLETLNISNLSDQDEEGIKPALLGSDAETSKTDEKQEKAPIKIEGEESGNDEVSSTEKVALSEITEETTKEKKKEKKKIEPIVLTTETKKKEEPKVAKSKDQSEPSIKNGWTVRVGTFSKSENVETISKLLDSSGFTTRHTEVETTLGKATRVWLGPYADKETADKVSTRLKTLTGEKGYVTKQASS
jgi:cell division septation protein DedD